MSLLLLERSRYISFSSQLESAERGRFELPKPFRIYVLSRDAHSTALASLHVKRKIKSESKGASNSASTLRLD